MRMAKTFPEQLQAGKILVADGATGTNYQLMGLGLGVPPEEWVFDAPDKVLALHRSFVEAGSDILLTDTFGGTRLRMRDSKYADRAPDVNRRAVELAREAIGARDVLVAGSMGPTGVLFEPFGDLTREDAVNTYAEQAAALTEGGADLLVLETFFALDEATAALEGARKASPLPVVVSFSFDRGTRTMMGLTPTQVVQAFVPLGIAAVGANCGKALDSMEQVITEMARTMQEQPHPVPLWAKPNAGLPRMVGDIATYDVAPEAMAEYAVRYVRAGARIVGGCCGSTAKHVAAIAQAVKQDGALSR